MTPQADVNPAAPVLEARELRKVFGLGARAVAALDGLTLSVPRGGVYGVLGPNGAGKSTLFRILLGLMRPSGGEIRVMGGAPGGDAARMRRIGSMIETPRFPPFLSGLELMQMLAAYSGDRAPRSALMGQLEAVGLGEAAHRRVDGYSVGMKQRLGLAAALLTGPELLVLDEPTNGMDPAGMLEIRRMIRRLADAREVTVILASHLLDEVEKTCDRAAIIARGRVRAEGSIAELTAGGERLRLTVQPPQAALALLGERGRLEGESVLAELPRAEAPELIRRLAMDGVQVFEAAWVGQRLEDVFLDQIGGADDR